MKETIHFKLNGKPVDLDVSGDRMLLWVLRSDLSLTGAKYGCGEGFCGTCTVLVDKEAVRACQFPLKDVKGREVMTVEGLSENGNLHPLQNAFLKNDALQCGFCTPGMVMSAYSLLLKKPRPTRTEIIQGLEDNLCRCGAHPRIVQAIQEAAREMKGANKK